MGAAFADAFERRWQAATERRYGRYQCQRRVPPDRRPADATVVDGVTGDASRSSLPLKKTFRADKRQ